MSGIRAVAILAAIVLVAPDFSSGVSHRPDPASAAWAVGRYHASFGHERTIPPPPSSPVARPPLPGPDAAVSHPGVTPPAVRHGFDWASAGARAAAMLGLLLPAAASLRGRINPRRQAS
jgi:hypothetical protein